MSRLSTKHVVLGLLVEHNSYGYALQQQVSQRFGFLGLADSAIYKTLERLEADGCVEEIAKKPIGRNARILYRATSNGREEFESWMAQACERPFLRDELHAKLALSSREDLPYLLAAVEKQSRQCLRDLLELGRQPRPAITARNVPWSVTSLLLVDDFRARFLECLVDWLAMVAEVIQDEIDGKTALTVS